MSITKNSIAVFIVLVAITIWCFSSIAMASASYKVKEETFSGALNPSRNYLLLVNINHPYSFNSGYDIDLQADLVSVSDAYGEEMLVEKGTLLAFTQLQTKLAKEGIFIGLFSAYRTEEEQQKVYDSCVKKTGWDNARLIMKPGYSEHHTGLLLNIVIINPDENDEDSPYDEAAKRQKTNASFKVIRENLADFGFIDRYPIGKEIITGAPCEPYAIRFVGSSDIAHEIMDNGLCLEEYLAKK